MSDGTRARLFGNWMLAFLAGGVTGASVALLLTPPQDSPTPQLRGARDTAALVIEVEDRLALRSQQRPDDHAVATPIDDATASDATTGETQPAAPAAFQP